MFCQISLISIISMFLLITHSWEKCSQQPLFNRTSWPETSEALVSPLTEDFVWSLPEASTISEKARGHSMTKRLPKKESYDPSSSRKSNPTAPRSCKGGNLVGMP